MNIHFHSPEYLYLLFALLPLFAYWRRRQMLKRFADKELGQALAPLASGKKYVLRDLLLLIAGALMIVVLARPQLAGSSDQGTDDKGIEAMICLDISNSMSLPADWTLLSARSPASWRICARTVWD